MGEEGLKGGMGGGGEGGFPGGFPGGGMPGGVRFSTRDPSDIFKAFFGGGDPFSMNDDDSPPFGNGGGFSFGGMPGGMPGGASFMHMGGGMPGGMNGFPGMHRPGGGGHASPPTKAAAVNHNLNVTLEELYTGAVKKMRITKRVIDAAGRQSQVSNEKEITLKKGWKDGTKITYEKEGDESPGVIPADIIFTVQTKPHPLYSRDNDDLIYTCTVTLLEALRGFKKEIRTLDNRPIFVEMRSVKPDTIKVD